MKKIISQKKFFYAATTLVLCLAFFIVLLNFTTFKSLAAGVSGDAVNASSTVSYDKINLKDELLTISDNKNAKLTNTTNGLQISGTAVSIKDTVFSFKETFNFNQNSVSRLCLYAISEKGSKLSIDFYLDNQDKPFTSIAIANQSSSTDWSKITDISKDIYNLKLTGKHDISFKISQTDKKSNINLVIKSVEFVESSIPVVYFNIDESKGTINAMNSDKEHNTTCTGDMTIQIPNGYKSEYTDKPLTSSTYSLEYIRGRGNSTWWVNVRKPYKIKLDKKADLFGMGSNKHWVLLANVYDNSLLRNKSTYWLGSELGLNYTPQSVFVDVVMNGEYYGNYMLCEQVRVDKTRVDIDDLEKTPDATDLDTISGGYLLSTGSEWGTDGKGFTTKYGNYFSIENPDFSEKINKSQYNYITNYIQQIEDAIYSKDFKTSDGIHYSELVDINSLIDYYWIQEFSTNYDAFSTGSTYLYKERNGKLFFGPLWDFDYVAWGNHYIDYTSLNIVYNSWFPRLFKDPEFVQKVKDRWPVIKESLTKLYKENGVINNYSKEISISQKYCFEKFGLTPQDTSSEPIEEYELSESEKRFQALFRDYENFLKKCKNNDVDFDIFEEDEGFFNNLECEVIDAFDENNIKFDNEDEEFFDKLESDNSNINPTLLDYCGYVEHEKAVIFLQVWIECRIDWITNNLSSLDNIEDKHNILEPCTAKFDFANGLEPVYVEGTARGNGIMSVKAPKSPSKKGYTFLGWYNSEYGYEEIVDSEGYIDIYEDTTFTAHFIANNKIIPIEKIELKFNEMYASFDTKDNLGYAFIDYSVYPENATFKNKLLFTSSDTSIAKSDSNSGSVVFSKSGTVTITVKDPFSGISTNCIIHAVNDLKIEDMTATKKDITLRPGEIINMPIEFKPANMNSECEWLSTDSSIAYVDNINKLHAVSEGTVEIRCYNWDLCKYLSYNVTVTSPDSGKSELKDNDIKPSNKKIDSSDSSSSANSEKIDSTPKTGDTMFTYACAFGLLISSIVLILLKFYKHQIIK